MITRRFGRTELAMPVLTCGGMRYQQSWQHDAEIRDESQAQVEAVVRRALDAGIHHIETARGYGTSEEQLGRFLPSLPRDEMIVQTKVSPTEDPAEFVRTFDESMAALRLDHVDLFGIHGINDAMRADWTLRPGGCLDRAIELQAAGRIRHIGFSTHAPLDVVLRLIEDGRFTFVNLHWYYVFRFQWPAIEAATRKDMGVFIISPNDKGGRLYEPSEKLVELTHPLTPMAWNDLWCLRRPEVHTLSIGAVRPSDFDAHLEAVRMLETGADLDATLAPIEERMHAELVRTLGESWLETWHVGLPEWSEVPGEINVREILRLGNFVQAFDMLEYGKARYNLLGQANHWFPGNRAEKLGELDLGPCLAKSPHAATIPDRLAEIHEMLAGEKVHRLGKH